MLIASANLNQRLGHAKSRQLVEKWLNGHSPDLLLSQESFQLDSAARPALSGYGLILTSPQISSWVADCHACPAAVTHTERWHEIRLAGLTVHNVYLSPYSPKDRRELLLELAEVIDGSVGPHLICGDFNLAPQPEDGIFGDEHSTYTTAGERKALAQLLQSAGLCDVMEHRSCGQVEFTFERIQKGKPCNFRCDLALAGC
jgi:exonuclease III